MILPIPFAGMRGVNISYQKRFMLLIKGATCAPCISMIGTGIVSII
jgi:hypothetical protein